MSRQDILSDTNPTAQCKMDAFKGKYERTSADQYDEFMKVYAFDDGNDINDGDDDDDYCVLDYEAYNWDSS